MRVIFISTFLNKLFSECWNNTRLIKIQCMETIPFFLFTMENRENRCLIRTPLIKLLKPTRKTRNRNDVFLPESRDVINDRQHRLQHKSLENLNQVFHNSNTHIRNTHSIDVNVYHVQGVYSLTCIAFMAASAQTEKNNVHVAPLTTHPQVALQRERRRNHSGLCSMSPAI